MLSSVLGKWRSVNLPFLFVSCLSRFSLLYHTTKRLAEHIGIRLAENTESSIIGNLNTSTQKEYSLVTDFFFHQTLYMHALE